MNVNVSVDIDVLKVKGARLTVDVSEALKGARFLAAVDKAVRARVADEVAWTLG